MRSEASEKIDVTTPICGNPLRESTLKLFLDFQGQIAGSLEFQGMDDIRLDLFDR